MRIVHAVRQYLPGVGGIETYVSQLAQAQALAGNDVRVVTLNRIFDCDDACLPPREMLAGVEVLRVPFRGSRRYPLAPGVLKHLADADVVHVHGIEFFADFLGWTWPLHRKPLLISTHGGFFHTRFARQIKQLWFGSVTRRTLRRYAAVLACSQQDQARFARLVGAKSLLLENAVDTDRFSGLAKRGARTLIYFGRLAPNKGLERLIPWFASLVQQAPQWRLIIAGKEMGTRIDELRALAAACGVGDAIRFHSHPSDEELRGLIAQSSAYAGASSYEGFGIAAVEAISAGLYPVLNAIPPFRRTIERVGHGLITSFDPGADIEEFLARLDRFENDQAAMDRLSHRLAAFGWDAVLSQIDRIYADAMATIPTAGAGRNKSGDDTLHGADDALSPFGPRSPGRSHSTGSFLGRKAPCASD